MTDRRINAYGHAARATQDILPEGNARYINMQSIYPDLNPVEHVLDQLKNIFGLSVGSQVQRYQNQMQQCIGQRQVNGRFKSAVASMRDGHKAV